MAKWGVGANSDEAKVLRLDEKLGITGDPKEDAARDTIAAKQVGAKDGYKQFQPGGEDPASYPQNFSKDQIHDDNTIPAQRLDSGPFEEP